MGARDLEREIHDFLRPWRTQGEWFKAPRRVIAWAHKAAWIKLRHPRLFDRWERYCAHLEAKQRVADIPTPSKVGGALDGGGGGAAPTGATPVPSSMTPSKRATNAARSVLRNPVNSKKAKQAAGLALTQRYMDVGVGT